MPLDPAAGTFPAPSQLPERPDLPDPLVTVAGDPVESPAAWRDRRAELEALFRHYVYGHDPGPLELETSVERTEGVLDGRATLLETTLAFPGVADAPALTLALFVPAGAEAVPVFLALNGEGNHATVADEAVTITDAGERFGADERGARASFWCVDRILERGYGFATVHCEEIDPDRDDRSEGIRAAVDPEALPGPPGTEWGTLAAWAWGLSRCVDHLQTVDAVRADQIAAIGHSRRGKATLFAGAVDERIGLVVPHQSGTGGCALSRENDQETVARINRAFPHWFDDVFPAFAGREAYLPVDQHCLVAMVAPRPLLDTEGARDYWLNPGRALDALRAAAPVWDLLGVEGTVGDGLRHAGDPITPETVGRLLQYRLETEHTLNRDYWDVILDFADLYFEPAAPA